MSLAGAVILAASAPATAAADPRKPAVAAPTAQESGPPVKKTEKMDCSEGRLPKMLGGEPWVLFVCDRNLLIVVADKGNPAKPFVFFLIPHRGGHRYGGVTIDYPDRSVTPPMPEGAAAARDELLALPADQMAALIAAVRKPGEALPPAPEHEEQWIGAWRLRTDRKARTFGIVWRNTGVIELAAASVDGRAKMVIRDNGTLLTASLDVPACGAGGRFKSYEGNSRSEGTLAHVAANAPTLCPAPAYEAEIRSWLPDFPAALRAMKARALALYGPNETRCMEPPFEPEKVPPPHPVCGWPPPEIGGNHPEPW